MGLFGKTTKQKEAEARQDEILLRLDRIDFMLAAILKSLADKKHPKHGENIYS